MINNGLTAVANNYHNNLAASFGFIIAPIVAILELVGTLVPMSLYFLWNCLSTPAL